MNAHHYGLTVSDMEDAITFYRDALGFDELHRADVDPQRLSEVVGVEDVEADLVFLDANGVVLELFEYRPAGDSIYDGKQQSTDVGAHHLAFEVDDADAVYDALSDASSSSVRLNTAALGPTSRTCTIRTATSSKSSSGVRWTSFGDQHVISTDRATSWGTQRSVSVSPGQTPSTSSSTVPSDG